MASLHFDPSNSSNPPPPDFPSDQADLLRDLAFHGYGDVGAHGRGHGPGRGSGHPNGEDSSLDEYMASLNAYASTGPPGGFENMEDSIALLQSLATFDQGPSNMDNMTPPPSNDHFESLLQAAATADGQEAAQEDSHPTPGSSRDNASPFFKRTFDPPTPTTGKRKRAKPQPPRTLGFLLPTKRQKALEREAAEQELEREEREEMEREIWGSDDDGDEDDDEGGNTSATSKYERPASATADARALGLHSAAALFRRPTSASKKYTRAPMSKLFTSLEIAPEQFLHLQAAAKEYMLDENHPDRSDCVGSKSKGGTDMVKLKLFACAEAFLEDEGWGERCFGASAMGSDTRRVKWPEMKNKIISLITPLLRRMVTNERQRQYALTTRKAKEPKQKVKRRPLPYPQCSNQYPNGQPPKSSSPRPDIDPTLDQYHYNPNQRSPAEAPQDQVSSQGSAKRLSKTATTQKEMLIKCQINILSGNHRIKPKVDLTPATDPGFSDFFRQVHGLLDGGKLQLCSIKAMGPDGQVAIKDDNSWRALMELVKGQEWMDGEIKFIVQVEDESTAFEET